MDIQIHHEVDKAIRALPQCVLDSFNTLENRLKQGDDLSEFINTIPFSLGDAIGNRTLLEHYHLRPCQPVCYLVYLLRLGKTVYILDISEHPKPGKFASNELEERLYSRLYDMCPDFKDYRLPGTYRSGFQVNKNDMYRVRFAKDVPCVAPVRTSSGDYLPLGQLKDFKEGRSRVGVIVGSFDIHRKKIPYDALQCIDSDDHTDMETLTLYDAGWKCYSGIFRKETEHLLLCFCSLHNVVIKVSTRKEPQVFAFSEENFQRVYQDYKVKFPSIDEKYLDPGEIVNTLIENFPLHTVSAQNQRNS